MQFSTKTSALEKTRTQCAIVAVSNGKPGATALALDALLGRLAQPVDIAVQLDVDTELLIDRLAGRAQAEGRADDSPDAVRNRLKVYNEATAPVVDFYRQAGRLARVDGVGGMDEVFQRILETLAPTPEIG